MSKLPKSDHCPQYKSTSHCLSSISSIKNSAFQHSSFYEFHSTYKFICVFVLQFYDPNLVVQFMYIKRTFYQQIKQVSTFHISSFEIVSDLLHNCTHCNHQLPTLLTLRNHSPFIIWLCNHSQLIIVIIIDHRLIILKLEYFSPFIYNHSHIYHSPTNCEGRVNLDLTFYLVLILV